MSDRRRGTWGTDSFYDRCPVCGRQKSQHTDREANACINTLLDRREQWYQEQGW